MKSPSRAIRRAYFCRLTFFALLCMSSMLLCVQSSAGASFAFDTTGSLATKRYAHTATLLPNGKVLVAGGFDDTAEPGSVIGAAELYDPATGTWSATGSLATARFFHTATLLPNGKVLVAGGYGNTGYLASAELYDPATGTWSATGGLATGRIRHTATLLLNGKVLVAGGQNNTPYLASAELYDPTTGSWSATGSLATARRNHTATLLPSGKVLVAAGYNSIVGSPYLSSAELYNPATGTWSATGSLATARQAHTATLLPNGKELVAGGFGYSGDLASAELYDPATGTWSATGSLATPRGAHTAILLPNGKVLVAGGGQYLASVELYNPATGTWSATGSLATTRSNHRATLLPNGKVLVVGGTNDISGVLASAEVYDPAEGNWSATAQFAPERSFHTATLLPNGKVLFAGGDAHYSGPAVASAELYDPATGTLTATGSLTTARQSHTTTLLPNGKVLVAGGGRYVYSDRAAVASAELYDPATGTWSATGSLIAARASHTATLLPNGKVLVAGGYNKNVAPASAELYDPATGTWSAAGSLIAPRASHTATLLPNGKVLVAGGAGDGSAEVYDPATGTWNATGSLATERDQHTATLLPNGKVLAAAGFGPIPFPWAPDDYYYDGLASAEVYDPATGTWSATGRLVGERYIHTATLLPNGKVLVAGGEYNADLDSAELYDPATGTWSTTASLARTRLGHTATLLPRGNVLVAGGTENALDTGPAELYDIGLYFSTEWQPHVVSYSATVNVGNKITLTGARFQGISQASGGSFQDSATNYPVVQLRSIDSSQVAFFPVDPTTGWSDTSFTSTPLSDFPAGPALVTVFTNGIPSDSKYLVVNNAATLTSVVSRKTRTGVDDFDIDLPLTGPRGVECRSGGPNNEYTLIFTFSAPVANCGTASQGVASSGPGANQCTINLSGLTNAQYYQVTLNGVDGAADVPGPQWGLLLGDVTGKGAVTNTDVAAVKSEVGAPVTSSNFANDVNANGIISNTDVALTKAQVGTTLP